MNGPTLRSLLLMPMLISIEASLCLLLGSASANDRTSHEVKTLAGERRSIQCKSNKSLGTFSLELANTNCSIDGKQVGTAAGNVTIFVPENSRLIYEPNALVIGQPKLMSAITPHGIDVLLLQALEADESELGKCDRVIEYAGGHFKELRELVIDASDVTDEGLAHLPNMPRLEAISTMGCHSIKGACLLSLSKFPNLQRLSLRDHLIDGSNFKYLSLFPKLTFLNLRFTGINEAGVKDISRCLRLSDLNLRGDHKVDDNCLAALVPMKHLRRLELCGTAVTDRGIEFLLRLPALKSLGLVDTRITLKGLAKLKSLKLEELTLSSQFSPRELKKIGPLSASTTFETHATKIDEDLKADFAPLH
jgi:Leucine-rich repeat (LRR) protein